MLMVQSTAPVLVLTYMAELGSVSCPIMSVNKNVGNFNRYPTGRDLINLLLKGERNNIPRKTPRSQNIAKNKNPSSQTYFSMNCFDL
jgi:hypothetical protein